jgi:hypothetical protein
MSPIVVHGASALHFRAGTADQRIGWKPKIKGRAQRKSAAQFVGSEQGGMWNPPTHIPTSKLKSRSYVR